MTTDWSGYEYLEFGARMSSGPATKVTVRISDSARRNTWTDYFLASVIVAPDTTTIRIPLAELAKEPGQPPIDLSDIQEIMIFARHPRSDAVMIMDDIRLQ